MIQAKTLQRGAAPFVAALCTLLGGCAEVDERPATWSYVHTTIIQANCTSSNCHSELAMTAGLDLHDKDAAYTSLTGRACGDPAGTSRDFVVPYEPESSKLIYQLRGIEVRSMPPDVPLPDAEIELIERWILEGAPCD